MLHPESNIQGQSINFEVDDFKSNNLLQMHFFQQNSQKQQKVRFNCYRDLQYYYEQEDGEVESKITTASPSKAQHYQAQQDDYGQAYLSNNHYKHQPENQHNLHFKGGNYEHNSQLPDFSPNAISDQKQDFSHSVITNQAQQQLTEKKLNNYLQQAKFLMSTSQTQSQAPFSPSQTSPYQNYQQETIQSRKNITKVKGKPFSQDLGNTQFNATEVMQMSHMQSYLPTHMQNIYQLDSCPSTQVLFNNNNYEEPMLSSDQINLKASFNSASKNQGYNNKKKSIDYGSRKSYSDKKSLIASSKAKLSNRDSVTNFYTQNRNSELSRASTQQKMQSNSRLIVKTSESPIKMKSATKANQIIDQLDNIIIEDVNDEGHQELQVLDYDDGDGNSEKQVDLGHIKAVNKRQASKTEVFSPIIHRKKASHVPQYSKQPPLLQQQSSTKSNASRASVIGTSHKKTLSTMQQQTSQGTRNTGLRSKHMTATTSPVFEKQHLDKAQARLRLTSGKKQNQTALTQPSPVKKQKKLTQNIEAIDEDDEQLQYRQQQHNETQQHPHFQLNHREFDLIMQQSITPSQSSNFQFQPKFFKPKFSTNPGQNQNSLEISDQMVLQSLVQNMEPRGSNQQEEHE